MSTVQLPIKSPMVTGYVHHGHVLSILAHAQESMDWLYSNYIQLYCHKNFEESTVPLNFFIYDELIYESEKKRYTTGLSHYLNSIPWLAVEKISRSLIRRMGQDGIHFLKGCIDEGSYIFTYIDEFFIPNTPFYQQQRFAHQVLIFGYNDENQTFDVADFVQDRHQTKYTRFNVAYEHMQEGFGQIELAGEHRQYTYLLRYRPHTSYPFDLEHVKSQLQAYISGHNSYDAMRNMQPSIELAFGIDVYNYLQQYLERLSREETAFDIRPFHIMWEHKTCMMGRLAHMEMSCGLKGMQEIAAHYITVEKLLRTIRLMLMMYQQNKDQTLIVKMIAMLQEAADLEKELLGQALGLLHTTNAHFEGGRL